MIDSALDRLLSLLAPVKGTQLTNEKEELR